MNRLIPTTLITLVASSALGCESLPGNREEQGAVIGGAAGAAAGAAINEENRLLGALIGGALGAGGGYLIGAKTDWFEDPDEAQDDAREAVQTAQSDPATAEDVERSTTADLNQDGFVTIDELVAMERAGLSDQEIVQRLEATGQVFELNASQEQQLISAGVSRDVVAEMSEINSDARVAVIGRQK
jgi:hypothetical protein